VWNLLSNAVKFTPRGGRIDVRIVEDAGDIEIIVTDTGIGFPVNFKPHVFERFRQAESGPTRPHGGLGLGLAIARHIVELHGGTIDAESAGEGQGATFKFRLPLLPVAKELQP
jgi:signal transduction histidine kinase